jgi:hypothetical protein
VPSGPPTGYPPPGPSAGYPPPGGPAYTPAGPQAFAQPARPPVRNSGRRTALLIIVTLAVIIGLILGALYLFRDRISGDVTALQVGDCIESPTGTEPISNIQHQPCTEPHDGEVFAVLTYPGDNTAAYPGVDAFRTFVAQQCLPQVQVYTGRTLAEIQSAGLTYAWFYPTTDSWTSQNDRGVTCYIAREDEQKMTGSVKAAGGANHSP